MLEDKIDVTAFIVWFIENYPGSVKIMKDNPKLDGARGEALRCLLYLFERDEAIRLLRAG